MPSERAALDPFSFDGVDRRGAEVVLRYSVAGEAFAERVVFPATLPDTPALDRALRLLHLLSGVSYYKAFAPRALRVPELSAAERALLHAMYDEGLRELAYVNRMELPLPVELIEDPALGSAPTAEPAVGLDGALVPVGGGKDSALVGALLPDATLMSVNPKGAHRHLAEHLERPLLAVERTLDPALRDLAERGLPNGHVPVTAIVSAIAVSLALATGRRDVVMGLERSASEPTLVHEGVPVNHQFSKSADAEALLRAAFAPTGVRYFSLLRPLSELAIAAAVVERGLGPHVLSCNEAFTMWRESDASRTQTPCGRCPKCLFSALILAPFTDPSTLHEMYQRDVFDDPSVEGGVRDLWSDAKPFECVGERHEAAAAMALLGNEPAWAGQHVVRALHEEARMVARDGGRGLGWYFELGPAPGLPQEYATLVTELGGSLAKVFLDAPG